LREIRPVEIEIPEGISVRLSEGVLYVKGDRGECSKDFNKIKVKIEVKEGKITLSPMGKKKSDYAILNTAASHIRNLFKGVKEGYVYKLKIVYSHFPISVKVKDGYILIENFYGEKAPRKAKVMGKLTKVSVSGDDVIVEGPCLEEVSQTAANIEQATRVKEKDQRIFLDGVYVYERKK
jgi:large subunit ribosomal protein L6